MNLDELRTANDVVLLALTVWREARSESDDAKIAVLYSILDRVHRPSWWGNDVSSVLFKKWQYSSLTDPRDPQLSTWPLWTDSTWQNCLILADTVYRGMAINPALGADSYFDDSISPPKWATPAMFVKKIGRLNFYNVDGKEG